MRTQSGPTGSGGGPSFVERLSAQLDCVITDPTHAPLYGPLWQYEPAATITDADAPDALYTVLLDRATRILDEAPPGFEYRAGVLADATIRAALYAEGVPHCTLTDVYRAGKQPEAADTDSVFSIEQTQRYVEDFVSAISMSPGKTKSASARFLAKGVLDNLSSVRYVSTQLFKILGSGDPSERELVETLVCLSTLGAMPHCRVVAPVEIRLWLYRNPPAAVAELTKQIKSKGLWLMVRRLSRARARARAPLLMSFTAPALQLVEFVSAVVDRWPILDRTLARATEPGEEGPARFKTVNNDLKLRKDVFSTIRYYILKTSPEGTRPPRSGRYNFSASGARCVPVVNQYDAALCHHGIKRKLSSKVISTIGPAHVGMYRAVVERAPWRRRVYPGMFDRLGVPDTEEGRALYVHAIEQRAAGLVLVPTLPVVETAQRRAMAAARFEPTVDVCARCNSLRETPSGESQNKATGGSLLCIKTGRKECANCGSSDVVAVDPCGYFFLWLARHIDRDQKVATVCGSCGRFAKPVALCGAIPVCDKCKVPKRGPQKRATACVICSTRLHRKTTPLHVLVENPRALDGTPRCAPVCHSCADLESPTTPWAATTMRKLLRPTKGPR